MTIIEVACILLQRKKRPHKSRLPSLTTRLRPSFLKPCDLICFIAAAQLLCSTLSIKQHPSPKMKLPQLPLLSTILLSTLTSLVSSTSPPAAFPNSITLSYEPVLGSSSVKPLATIFYDPKTLKSSLSSWTPPVVDTQSTTPEPDRKSVV